MKIKKEERQFLEQKGKNHILEWEGNYKNKYHEFLKIKVNFK
jgi:hypothetical protein